MKYYFLKTMYFKGLKGKLLNYTRDLIIFRNLS